MNHSPAPAQPRRGVLPRFLVVVLALAASLVALSQLREVSSLVAPAFLALNLIITAYPLQRVLVRRGAPAWLGAVVAGLAVLVALLLIVGGLAYCVAAMVGEMPKYTDQFTSLYNQALDQLGRLGFDESQLLKSLKGVSPSSVMGVLGGVLTNLSSVGSLAVVVVTTLIFMVMDSIQVERRLAAVGRNHPEIAHALSSFATGIRKYWLVATAFGLVVAVIDYAILAALGVPLALVWAMFSFLTNYVPNIGFVLGIIPPALLAMVEKGWKTALAVVVLYSVVNFVIQSIIQPRVAGDAVGLTPTMSFFSLLLWGWVFGGLGALIALPLSLLVKAMLVDIDPGTRWVNAMIDSALPTPEPAKALGTPEKA